MSGPGRPSRTAVYQRMEDAVRELRVMPAVAGPVKLLPLPALATADLSENALRVAAVRGRLKAIKGDDGTWRSSRRWVTEYARSRHRRRPRG